MAKWTDQVPQTQGYPVQEGSDQVRENCLSWLGGHLAETHWSPTSCLSPGYGILLLLDILLLEMKLELMKLAGTTIKQYVQAVALLIPMF